MCSSEVMALLLGKPIINTSAFIPTEVPNFRTAVVMPTYIIVDNADHSYFRDTIKKYFARPVGATFDDMKYPDYCNHYALSSAGRGSGVVKDSLQNFLHRR